MRFQHLFTFVLATGALQSWAAGDSRIVEVPIERVFVPARGFDDNDSVEAVVDGSLPNACYVLEKQSVDVDVGRKVVTVRQFAIRLTSGSCRIGSEPNSPEFNTPIPFTETINLGKMEVGDYKILYYPASAAPRTKTFQVGSSPVPTLDTLPYAMVTEVSVSDIVPLGKAVEVQLSGILNNSCYHLNDKVAVDRIDDVTVVMPTVRVDRQNACLMFTRPFTKTLQLEGIKQEERHLIHVRSMNGKSLNRVYSVKRIPR